MMCPRCGMAIPDVSAWCPSRGSQVAPPPQSLPNRQPPAPSGVPPCPPPYPYQYYPGQSPYGQPPPPRDDSPKKVVKLAIIAVVAIACVIVIAALLFLTIQGTEPEPGMSVVLNFSSPSVEPQVRNGTMVWDGTLMINRRSPRESTVRWSHLSAVIRSSNGTVILASTSLDADPGVYDISAPIRIEVWYNESLEAGTTADPGDAIKITGMSTDCEGAVVELVLDGQRIGMVWLPADFP